MQCSNLITNLYWPSTTSKTWLESTPSQSTAPLTENTSETTHCLSLKFCITFVFQFYYSILFYYRYYSRTKRNETKNWCIIGDVQMANNHCICPVECGCKTMKLMYLQLKISWVLLVYQKPLIAQVFHQFVTRRFSVYVLNGERI